MKLYKAETANIAVTDGTITSDRHRPPHRHRQPGRRAARLVVTGQPRQTAGAAQGADTITATDPYGNTDTGYTGDQNLTFSGANSSTNPVTAPTVTQQRAAATELRLNHGRSPSPAASPPPAAR